VYIENKQIIYVYTSICEHTPQSSAEVTIGYSYISMHPLGLFRPVMGLFYLYICEQPTEIVASGRGKTVPPSKRAPEER
jgi:hypothetical protein